MNQLSEDAISRLRVVQKQIVESPKFYDQNIFGRKTPCGTVCCVAGWLHYNKVGAKAHLEALKRGDNGGDIGRIAQRILGMSEYPKLFYTAWDWPETFRDDYFNARTPLQRAKVAVRRIDHFIETGE